MTEFVRFKKIYTNSPEIQKTSFASFEFLRAICINLCKSDKISRHILGLLVKKYVDLTKINL